MYYPILRGKQNELLALRELVEANVLGNYTPIIEPVKNNFSSLIKAIEELNKKGIEPVVIVNPDKGDFKKSNPILSYKNIQNEKDDLSFLPCINYQDPRAADIIKGLSRYSIISNGASQELVQASHTAEKTIIKADVSPVILEEMKNVILFDDFFNLKIKMLIIHLSQNLQEFIHIIKNRPMLLVLGIIRLQALNSLKVVDPPMLLQSIYRTLMKNVIMKNI